MRFLSLIFVFCLFLTSCLLQNPQNRTQQPSANPLYNSQIPPQLPVNPPVTAEPDEDDDRDSRFDRDRDNDDGDYEKISERNSPFNKGRRSSSTRRSRNSSKTCDERDWDEDLCYQDDLCIDSCRGMFPGRRLRTRCENYPLELVYQMQLMLEDLETGLSDNLDTDVLRCMGKISAQPFLKKVRRFNDRDKKDFLIVIAEDEEIAKAVFSADDDLVLFDDLAESNLENLIENLEGGVNFVTLVIESYNDEAWNYLEEYLDDYCETGNNCSSSRGSNDKKNDKFIAYCKMLAEADENDVESVVESDLFQDEYDKDIEYNDESEELFCHNYNVEAKAQEGKSSGYEQCEADDYEDFARVCDYYNITLDLD